MQRRKIFSFFIMLLAATFVFSTVPVMAKSTGDSSAGGSGKHRAISTSKKTSAKKKSKKKTKAIKKKVGKININTADEETLTELTGVGPVTAKKIIAYRKKHGKFSSAQDLLNVKGIGEKTLENMKSQLKF